VRPSVRGEQLRTAILTAESQPISGSKSGARLIKLPDGVEWPQLGAAPLFVRPFYKDCYESQEVVGCLPPGSRFYVRGNSGIGKSAFGNYLLYQCIRAGRTTVYISDKVPLCFIFHKDGRVEQASRRHSVDAAGDLLLDPQTVLLFDGDGDRDTLRRTPIVGATTVLPLGFAPFADIK
jgi:hypothetical protein